MVPVMLEDADGLLWMAGSQGTLHRARERRVASLRVNAVEEGLTVSSVCIGRDGIVWIGTDDAGVFRFANNALTQITNGLANLHIHSVFVDRRTNVWVGTLNGLYRWRDTRFARYALPVSSTPVSALFEDRRGNVWAGTGKGLVRIRPDGAATLFAEAAGLDHFFFRSLAEDAQGRLCVAMGDRGLYRMAGERFELFGSDRWSGAELIRGLHAEADGGLWLTTSGAGLFRFQDGVFRQWTKADGLPEMTLNGIVEDERNNLWFSSENGIFGCPKAALLAERGGRSGPLLFWHLSVADGMDTKACSGSGQPVVARSADGHFWVPNRRALAVFDPAEVTRFGNMWTPFVEGVVADGVPVRTDGDGVLRLRSGARRVEFHYTCPDLHSPERLRFRYRLEDSDADWTDAGAQRVAYYGQLPPGVYRFRVLAGGAAGEWREAAAVLPLTIVPQWWERTALRVTGGFSGALLLGGTVWLLARARGRRKLARLQLQHARESERRRIARDIHDDLGATLTRVALLGDMSSSPEEAQSHLHKISAAARDMSQSLEAIVWAVRPENDTLRSLADYLERRADEIFEGAPATCRFVAPREFPERLVFAEARHNVFLACKEALTNALKHAPTAEVRVELVCTGDECLITVADNGPGFDPESARAGAAGLKNMRWRMEEIGGRFELHSQRGKGTTVRLGFPVLRPSAS
jgi:signal transduction histidine kinase/streptogramin lyase